MADKEHEVDIEEAAESDNTIWFRGFYMLLFALFYTVAEVVMWVVVVVQFGHNFLQGESHPRLRRLGRSLASYIYQIVCFLTFNSEEKPYPFSEWPGADGER